MEKDLLNVQLLGRGFAWLDTGTQESMLEASNFVYAMEKNKGEQISCIEEIALHKGFITPEELAQNLEKYFGKSSYYNYVKDIIEKWN